jgi:hypothetical protein
MQDCLGAWHWWSRLISKAFLKGSLVLARTQSTHIFQKLARARTRTHTSYVHTLIAHTHGWHWHNACAGFGLHQVLHQTTSTAFWKWATFLQGVPPDAHQKQVGKLLKTAIKSAQGRDILRGIVRDRNAQSWRCNALMQCSKFWCCAR